MELRCMKGQSRRGPWSAPFHDEFNKAAAALMTCFALVIMWQGRG